MPNHGSQDSIIRKAEGLIDAIDRTPEVQVMLEAERDALGQPLTEVKLLKARQQELTAQRQEVTQLLHEALKRLKDAAMTFRTVVRGKLGIRNERLVQFGVAPLRPRPRQPTVLVVEKPSDGEASGTKPGASTSPSAKPVV
jgi:hypothetical protein